MTNYQKQILLNIIANGSYLAALKTKKGYMHYVVTGNKRQLIRSDTSKAINRYLHSIQLKTTTN